MKRRKPSLASRVLGEFAYFENGQHRVVPVFNKQQMFKKLLELEERSPWVEKYRYVQLRR